MLLKIWCAVAVPTTHLTRHRDVILSAREFLRNTLEYIIVPPSRCNRIPFVLLGFSDVRAAGEEAGLNLKGDGWGQAEGGAAGRYPSSPAGLIHVSRQSMPSLRNGIAGLLCLCC